jgi:hypothetical protein
MSVLVLHTQQNIFHFVSGLVVYSEHHRQKFSLGAFLSLRSGY